MKLMYADDTTAFLPTSLVSPRDIGREFKMRQQIYMFVLDVTQPTTNQCKVKNMFKIAVTF